MKALRYVDELNEKGIKAQFSVLETLEETEQFAKSRGIAKSRNSIIKLSERIKYETIKNCSDKGQT